ncbi:hypothetical protein V2J09_001291 [Rumex salicifolius]
MGFSHLYFSSFFLLNFFYSLHFTVSAEKHQEYQLQDVINAPPKAPVTYNPPTPPVKPYTPPPATVKPPAPPVKPYMPPPVAPAPPVVAPYTPPPTAPAPPVVTPPTPYRPPVKKEGSYLTLKILIINCLHEKFNYFTHQSEN